MFGLKRIPKHHYTHHAKGCPTSPQRIIAVALGIALWNANSLSSHLLELQTFLDMHDIYIALISETHFTSRTVFRLPRYTVLHTTHPDDTAHGCAVIIIRSSLRHHEHLRLQTNELQVISLNL